MSDGAHSTIPARSIRRYAVRERTPPVRRRDKKVSRPPWGKVSGRGPRLALVGLLSGADSEGVNANAHESISAYAGGSPESRRKWLIELQQVGVIEMVSIRRDHVGQFERDCYRVKTENPEVVKLISHLQSTFARLSPASSQPLQNCGAQQDSLSVENGEPEPISSEPSPVSGAGAYIEARAGARASETIFFHTLPENHGIDDEELAEQTAKVLSVCGEGTKGVHTPKLIRSLAYHIPRALENGYDFDKDIVACIEFRTGNPRKAPLDRFDVTFNEDIPEWRNERLRREASRAAKRKGHSARKDQSATKAQDDERKDLLGRTIIALGSRETDQWRRSRIAALTRMIAASMSKFTGDRHNLRLLLDLHQRDLTADELDEALRPHVAHWEAERESLLQLLGQ